MSAGFTSPGTGSRTTITCTKCGKEATVPFAPTPGRPVFCRDCFVRPVGGSFGGGSSPQRGPESPNARAAKAALPGKKRMMAQGRKTHFIYDAKAILSGMEGGMQDEDQRAFLEGLFARGARTSTEAAQVFLEQKVTDGAVTHEQAIQIGGLIDKYSFYR